MAIDKFVLLVLRTKTEYPRFRVVPRDKSWLKPVFWLLSKLTRTDYSEFTTTIFSTMYTGSSWSKKTSDQRYATLRHEKSHIKQAHCFPFGRRAWPLNHALWALCYLFVLPFFWTFRAKFEREGYLQTLLVEYELRGPFNTARMISNAKWISKTFGTSTYAWMWTRKKAYEWAMDVQAKINTGQIQNLKDQVGPGTPATQQPPPRPALPLRAPTLE